MIKNDEVSKCNAKQKCIKTMQYINADSCLCCDCWRHWSLSKIIMKDGNVNKNLVLSVSGSIIVLNGSNGGDAVRVGSAML